MIKPLMHSAKVGVIAASMLAGYPTLASAHSFKDCAWDVIEFCGSDQACKQSGIAQCHGHSHPGGRVPDPPDPVMSTDPGRQPGQPNQNMTQ